MDMNIAAKAAETEFDPEQVRAELDRAAELAMASPASQAACDIMRLVRRKSPAIKTMPVTTRFRGAGVRTDEMDRWWGLSRWDNSHRFSPLERPGLHP